MNKVYYGVPNEAFVAAEFSKGMYYVAKTTSIMSSLDAVTLPLTPQSGRQNFVMHLVIGSLLCSVNRKTHLPAGCFRRLS